VLKGLGFTQKDFAQSCADFSGGWQMKIALARYIYTYVYVGSYVYICIFFLALARYVHTSMYVGIYVCILHVVFMNVYMYVYLFVPMCVVVC